MPGAAERIGTYEVVRLIDRGGMAAVYEARQPALDRTVALKRLDLRSTDPMVAARFVREGRIAASLSHPNIVTVFDFFECDGVPYIAMEYLVRGSLRRWIGRTSLPQVFGVLEGVLAALAHAEGRGIAHRDLKPENVLVAERGVVKIADFGIAKAYTATTGGLTDTGLAIGTPAYMAPEQALGRPVGAHTDLYAVGAIAFELLAGAPPFGSTGTAMALMYRHVHEGAPRLQGVDQRLATWVAWLLEKAPAARPPSAGEAWSALEEVVVGLLGPYWRRHSVLDEPHRERADALAHLPEGAGSGETSAAALPADAVTRQPGAPPPPATRVLASAEPHAATTPEPSAAGGAPPSVAATRRQAATAASEDGWAATTAIPRTHQRHTGARPDRARRLLAAAATIALVAGGTVLIATKPWRSEVDVAAPPGRGAPARAFDFDGTGRRSIVAGLPGWRSPAGAALPGAVALPQGAQLLTAGRFGRPGRELGGGGYGASIASADFDRDGYADLAIGAPTADLAGDARAEGGVRVLYGSDRGIGTHGRVQVLRGPGIDAPFLAARYGAVLAAGDLNGDRFGDLLVGAPGTDATAKGASGGLRVLFGGPKGLSGADTIVIRNPGRAHARFGTLLALGDIDRDGRMDAVAGGSGDPGRGVPGYVAYCRTRPDGPRTCRTLTGIAPDRLAALAVGDVNGDGFSDVVVGAPSHHDGAGAVMVWLGTARGPAARPRLLTQRSRRVPGTEEPGDAFGSAIAVAPVDGDRFADIVVGAPGEENGAGRVTVIHGGPRGFPLSRTTYGPFTPGIKSVGRGDHFGAEIAVLDTVGSRRRDLVVSVPGDRSLITLQGGGAAFDGARPRITDLTNFTRGGRLPAGTPIRLGQPDPA